LEEDIKKDLREIEEEVKEKEKTSEVEEKLDITPEKAEGLVEKLIKSEEEKEEVPERKPPRFKPRDLVLISGSIFVLIFILLGVWIGLKLIKGEVNKEEKVLSESEIKIPESQAFKKFSKIVIVKEEKEREYPYKLELKNFLIPLGIKEFLSLNVTLYFDNSTSTKEIAEAELDFREKLYSYFKNIPPNTWKNEEAVKLLQEKLKESLEKDNIKPIPQKIRFEGTILKG